MMASQSTPHLPTPDIKSTVLKAFALISFGALMTTFGPFILFAPVAFALSYLHFDKKISVLIQLIVGAGFFFLSGGGVVGLSNLALYSLGVVEGYVINEVIERKLAPVNGVLIGGALVNLLIFSLIGIFVLIGDQSLYDLILSQVNNGIAQLKSNQEFQNALNLGGEKAILLKEVLGKPGEMTKEILSWSFSVIFSGIFLSVWASFYFVLRNSLAWRLKKNYPFGVVHFTHFKLPFSLVYLLIVGLALTLGGEYIAPYVSVIGMNVLYCLGALYFFQGFGLMYDFLVVKRIGGFLRSLVIMSALLFAWRFIAFLGLFDVWVNFRKFLKKKDEGDR